MTEQKDLSTGIWKFSDRVTRDELGEVADEWADDEHYEQLYIRRTSKDQHGIGFSYRYDGTEESHQAFLDEATDILKRRFGNDFVGWDVAGRTYTIKGM